MKHLLLIIVGIFMLAINSHIYAQTCNLSATTTITAPICYGSSGGSITAAATGGSGNYQYQLSESGAGGWQTSPSFTGLISGTYPLSIRDVNNKACLITQYVTVTQPDSMSITYNYTNATCASAQDGKIFVSLTGGTAPYTYTWTGSSSATHGPKGKMDTLIVGAGNYNLTVQDGHGCSKQPGYLAFADTVSLAQNGFNQDVVAESLSTNNATPYGTTASIDNKEGSGSIFYETGFNSLSNGLTSPYSTAIQSAQEPSRLYRMKPYTVNNVLQLGNSSINPLTGSLTFNMPKAYAKLYVMGTSGNGASTLTYTITFNDNSTYTDASPITLRDWLANSGGDIVKDNINRIGASNATQDTRSFALLEAPINIPPANWAKPIKSISFTQTNASTAGVPSIFAISGYTATANNIAISVIDPSVAVPKVTLTSDANTSNTYCATSSTGQIVTYTAHATAVGVNPKYEWYVSTNNTDYTHIQGTGIGSGINAATYTRTMTNNDNTYVYVIVTPDNTSAPCIATGATATSPILTLTRGTVTPTVTISGPTTLCQGTPATYFVSAATDSGTAPSYLVAPTFQWQVNGSAVNGATGRSITTSAITSNIQVAMTSAIACAVKPVNSNAIFPTVNAPQTVTISSTPYNPPVTMGLTNFNSTVTAATPTPAYQWFYFPASGTGGPISGATNSTLLNRQVLAGDQYALQITPATSCPSSMSNYLSEQSIAYPLPITMDWFRVGIQNSQVALQWKTTTEINAKEFQIQRALSTSQTFETIGKVAARNISTGALYSFQDVPPIAGKYLYRIQNIDFDGESAFSDVQSVDWLNNNNYQVFPIPFKDILHVTLNAAANTEAHFILYSISGQQVYSYVRNLSIGVQQTDLKGLSNIVPGTYILKVVTATGTLLTQKVVKQ